SKLNEFMQQGMTDQGDQLMNERQQALYAGANPATQSKMNAWLSQSQLQSQKQNAQDIENQPRLARTQDITTGIGGTSTSDLPQPDGTTKTSPLPNYLDTRSQYQQIIGSPQVSQPGGTPPQQSAPQVGEQRMINGTLAEWDGKGWMPVAATDLGQ